MKKELYRKDNYSLNYRTETTDLNCIKEVVEQRCYRHTRFKFDVEKDESWLDLGANMGAFALYCKLRGVKKYMGFEPIPENFRLLNGNVNGFLDKNYNCFNTAITNIESSSLEFFGGSKSSDRYRMTIMENKRPLGKFNNMHMSELINMIGDDFDGIKLDIEGSELGLIDDKLIPKCNKLVMEYHITKDKSMANFRRRMDYLRTIFGEVYYMKSLDTPYPNDEYPGFFDRIIYCKNN